MADGTDEGGARAAVMDEWIIWEAEEKVSPGAPFDIVSFPFFYFVGELMPRDSEAFLYCGRRG